MRWSWLVVLFMSAVLLFAETAKVRYMIGEVRVKRAGQQGNWEALTMQTDLQEKDVVRTGPEAYCEIELPDGSVVKVLQNSMMELRNFPKAQNEKEEIFTSLGKFFFMVKKALQRKFVVSTPVAVAAIRGTEFMLVTQGKQTKLLVREGLVEFGDLQGVNRVQVASGQKSLLQFGSPPEPPSALSEAEKKALDKIAGEQKGIKKKTPKKKMKQTPAPAPSGNIEKTPPPPPKPAPEAKPPQEEKPQPRSMKKGGGVNTGVSIGAVTIDGKLYNQIGLRPEFSIGKLGVALDLSLYIDDQGNIRKENWDSARDIFEKIYYVRWGHHGDPLYVKVGAVDNYRLGFGILMNHYSNTVEYPNVIRTGLEFGLQGDRMGFDAMINNFSELTNGGGLLAGRFTYRALGKLTLGASVVYDRNQYKTLKDRDGDGVPDYLDPFPDDKNYAIDSDGDGIPDEDDPDRDGNGFTDNAEWLINHGYDSTYINDDAYKADPENWALTHLKPEPFNINKAKDKAQFALALDASYPIVNMKYLQLTTYAQWANFPYNNGWGITAPGFWAKFAFINAYAEYRIFSKHFLPEYFNTTYELERAVFRTSDTLGVIEPVSKRKLLDNVNEQLKGFVVGADFNLFNFLIFGAEYQNMSKSNLRIRTFRSTLDLNTSFIPKINRAGAYYYQNNARELFKKTEGTILGYRIEYEISPGASLLVDFRQTYRDLNGDGKISGPGETVKTTNIQTVIRF